VLCLLCVTPLVCSSYSSFAPSSSFFSSWWQKNCDLFTHTLVLLCLLDGICCTCPVTSVVANCWRCRCFVRFMWLLASLTSSMCPFIVLGEVLDSLAICRSFRSAWSLGLAFLISGSLEEYFVVFNVSSESGCMSGPSSLASRSRESIWPRCCLGSVLDDGD